MKSLSLLSLFLVLHLTAICQNNFTKEYRFDQQLSITQGGIASPDAADIIIRLAEGNNKAPRSTAITVKFDQQLTINTREPGIVYTIQSGTLQLGGDLYYKGFECSNQLTPTEVTYTLRLTARNGFTKDFSFTNKIVNGKPEASTTTYTDTTGRVYTFSIINVTLFYKSSGKNIFNVRTQLINDYYTSISKLDNAYALLQSVDPRDIDHFKIMQDKLNDAGNVFQSVEHKLFDQQLNLSQNDPGRLLEKSGYFRTLLFSKQTEMEEVRRNLHITFFNRGLAFLQNGALNKAEDNFKMSLDVNPAFAPALLQLGILDYRKGNLNEASCKAEDVIYNLHPDPNTRDQTNDLLSDIYSAYLDRAQIQIQKQNFQKALDQFDAAAAICEKFRTVKCSDELFSGYRTAHQGIYTGLLEMARSVAQTNNLILALDFTEKAIQYQLAHPRELPNNFEAIEVRKAIQQKKMNSTIASAKNNTAQRQFETALNELKAAEDLNMQYGLMLPTDFSKIVFTAARPRILELLEDGNVKVKLNQLDDARSDYQSALNFQKQYTITGDKEINQKTETLRKSIYSQECLNAQTAIDQFYTGAKRNVTEQAFLEANSLLEQAIDIKAKNPNCGLKADSVEALINEIHPVVTYLKFMKKSKDDELNGDYNQSLDAYRAATKYYAEYSINDFGILHVSEEYTYIRDSGSNGLIYYKASQYTESNELEKALIYYQLLLSRNYDHLTLEGSLYKLGFKTGVRDRPGHKSKEWKKMVKFYVDGSKKMKGFTKGYSKGFKS
ncbi:hypothetical protein BH11BAC2_BH11BAC2_18170 [soil metagenome]